MDKNADAAGRRLLGWIAMIVGAAFGWGVADLGWQFTHHLGVGVTAFGGPPVRGWDYYVIAVFCAIAGAALGLAAARFRELPAD
jgi:TRAP-type C4-dicarboxylate transport system permease small subunit